MLYSPEDLERFFSQQSEIPSLETLTLSNEKAHELRTQLNALLETPGYKTLCAHIREQISERLTENLQKPSGLDGIITMSYINGEIAGLKLALDFVSILIDGCDDRLAVNKRLSESYYPDEQGDS